MKYVILRLSTRTGHRPGFFSHFAQKLKEKKLNETETQADFLQKTQEFYAKTQVFGNFQNSYKSFYIIEVVYLAYNLIKSPEIEQNLKKWQDFSVKLK